MPTGVYQRTEYHKSIISETNKKRWAGVAKKERSRYMKLLSEAGVRASQEVMKGKFAAMTEEEKLEYLRPWMRAGAKATRERFAIMTREERIKFTRPGKEAMRERFVAMTRGERLEYTRTATEAMKKKFAGMSKRERLEVTGKFRKAGAVGTQERWNKMPKKERMRVLEPWIRAGIESNQKQWTGKSRKERRERMRPAFEASQRANPSSIEEAIWEVLNNLNIDYETQVSFNGGKFIVDIYVPEQRLIIECQGDYWHNLLKAKRRDRRLREYTKSNNYKLIELWESEIRRNPRQALEDGLELNGVYIK